MAKAKTSKLYLVIAIIGTILIFGTAYFCYSTVKETIIENEQKSLLNFAEVNAHSLKTSIQAKQNLIFAALSGDMENEEAIETNIFKIGEKGGYIPIADAADLTEWNKSVCKEAGKNPGEVITGPIRQSNAGYYILYMTKAVYMNGSIVGYAQIELNLDDIFQEEQALSELQLSNDGYCLIKDENGTTIMPSSGHETEFELSGTAAQGYWIGTVYAVDGGTPVQQRELITYQTFYAGNEKLYLYIAENYDQVVQPIERISLYFTMIGAVLITWLGFFMYRMQQQQKEEQQLKMELAYEKELNQANDLMEQYNHYKTLGTLTGAIAHEFNNLMTPIVLYSNLMEENQTVKNEMPEEVGGLVQIAGRCETLATQLLDYCRQGRTKKVLTDYNALPAVKGSVNIIKSMIPNNVELKTLIQEKEVYIRGQKGTLNQIIVNLAANAVYAMPDGGVLNIQFGVSADDDKMVRLVVTDTGKGIPEEIREIVFEPFFTTHPEKKGNGIGLTVVRRLTEEQGGNIRVRSETGKGTRFLIEFPRIEKPQ